MQGALVIGYGNPLRGDDGVGPAVATALAEMGGVDGMDLIVLDPVQLTPELAVDVASAAAVIFVDAQVDEVAGMVRSAALTPGDAVTGAFSHAATPAGLLALARDLYGVVPPAWVVSVGAVSFAPGDGLSPAVAAAVPVAMAQVRRLLAGAGRE
ncbi:MAG: hydrogenase maturation protease [Chloroflexi bacterium]|nr:hydrogenase maturation protease [Chloroflexota bacterium]